MATPPTWVATYNGNAATVTTSPITYSVTAAAGDTLVHVGLSGFEQTVPATPTGGTGITWVQSGAQNPTGATAGVSPVIIWTTTVASAQTFTLSETVGAANAWTCFTLRFSGVPGIGATSNASAPSGTAPQTSLTTTQDNSTIVTAIADYNGVSGASRVWVTTAGALTEVDYQFTSGSMTGYGAYQADVGVAGAKTVGLSAPSTGFAWSIVALELKGSATATPMRRIGKFVF